MVFHMMKRIMKFMVKIMRWLTRAIEKGLETLGTNDIPAVEHPMVDDNEREQAEEINEQGRNDIPGEWEEIPAPAPPQNNQTTHEGGPDETLMCPLRDNIMRTKRASKGGYFYGCTQWQACNGYRNKISNRPGPAANINNLRNIW